MLPSFAKLKKNDLALYTRKASSEVKEYQHQPVLYMILQNEAKRRNTVLFTCAKCYTGLFVDPGTSIISLKIAASLTNFTALTRTPGHI